MATREGWLYLASVLDVCSRRIVGWAMASQQTLDLAEWALHMAIVHRRPAPGLILHHDRGSQYTSARYRSKVEAAKMILSMSRPGTPYDNAMAESFFSTLKLEGVSDNAFVTREAARLAVFDYIEVFYNRTRMHSALEYQSPAQYGGFIRSMQHIASCLGSRSVANEAKDADSVHRQPEGLDAGSVAARRVVAPDRPAV